MCDALQAQVVLAFEQSLTNMTQRLQHLAVTANEKVSGLTNEAITPHWGIRDTCSLDLLKTISCYFDHRNNGMHTNVSSF